MAFSKRDKSLEGRETGRVEDFSLKTLRLQTSDFSQPPYLHKKRARRLFFFPISPHMPRRKDEAECHHARRHQCHGVIMASRPPEGKRGEDRKEKKFDGIRHRELQRIVTWDWVL